MTSEIASATAGQRTNAREREGIELPLQSTIGATELRLRYEHDRVARSRSIRGNPEDPRSSRARSDRSTPIDASHVMVYLRLVRP